MPVSRKEKKDQRSPVLNNSPSPPPKKSTPVKDNTPPPKDKTKKKVKEEAEEVVDIIPETKSNDKKKNENIKLARYKVSIREFDPKKIIVGEAVKMSFDTTDKDGKKVTIKNETHSIEYNYSERPMYSKDSKKQGTYPAEKGPCIIGCPPWISDNGFNNANGKYFAYFLIKSNHIAPEDLSEEEKDKMFEEYDALIDIFINKMTEAGEVIARQLCKLYKAGKCNIEGLVDKKKTDDNDGETVFKENPEEVIEEFVKVQKRNEKRDKTLPRAIKVAMKKSRMGDIDNTVINLPGGGELPPSEWGSLEGMSITTEMDIRLYQILFNSKAYLQILGRSLLILDLTERKSTSTLEESVAKWAAHDSGRADSVRRQLELASQKVKTKTLQKESLKNMKEGSSEEGKSSFDGIVNKKKKKSSDDDDDDDVDMDKLSEKTKKAMKAALKKGEDISFD